jgi:hypothetical protein
MSILAGVSIENRGKIIVLVIVMVLASMIVACALLFDPDPQKAL